MQQQYVVVSKLGKWQFIFTTAATLLGPQKLSHNPSPMSSFLRGYATSVTVALLVGQAHRGPWSPNLLLEWANGKVFNRTRPL